MFGHSCQLQRDTRKGTCEWRYLPSLALECVYTRFTLCGRFEKSKLEHGREARNQMSLKDSRSVPMNSHTNMLLVPRSSIATPTRPWPLAEQVPSAPSAPFASSAEGPFCLRGPGRLGLCVPFLGLGWSFVLETCSAHFKCRYLLCLKIGGTYKMGSIPLVSLQDPPARPQVVPLQPRGLNPCTGQRTPR